MSIAMKNFDGGYSVEFDTTGKRYGCDTPQCYVSRGRFAASWDCLQDTGLLYHNDAEIRVPSTVVLQIESWLQDVGYLE